ncbi:N-acetyltransferase family protein [Affinibrenneria salicis]|uniref:N-acetyltransferase family protein n=2 Tax=Affinibrenneria salicis TaxID=2590031 RepID=A0A5J5FWS9_9GAMM|nr:N-acetyltransferase family protein [Affinibrenneria salicis]
MKQVNCTEQRHAAQILAIFNEAILNSTALYDYHARTDDDMRAWFAAKSKNNLPVFGIEDEQGNLLGFATYGAFRDRPANKYSIEHSIYVHKDARGQGIGRRLLNELIESAKAQGFHTLIGGIDAENHVSIVMHEKAGFRHAGTIAQAAFKFDRWLDLAFYQLILDTPQNPVAD